MPHRYARHQASREGGRSEARQGAGDKTAEDSMHAEGQPVRKSRAETQKAKAIKGKPRGNMTGRQAGSQ